jgi:hypothetical protein
VVELLEEYRGIFAWSIYDLRDTAVEGVEFEVNLHRRQGDICATTTPVPL